MTAPAPFETGTVRGFLHRPDRDAGSALVLTHGAGGDCKSPLLVAVASAFCAAGLLVLRCDLPFRRQRPSGPPSPAGAAQDRAGLKHAVLAVRDMVSGRIILGGQSYGGRQATLLAADEPHLVDALLLLSYPLHPPGKSDRPRTEHFPRLQVPCVFVSGTRDPFGSIAELQQAAALITVPARMIEIENAGHDLRRGRFDMAAMIEAVSRSI